jgi:hypothetical protein
MNEAKQEKVEWPLLGRTYSSYFEVKVSTRLMGCLLANLNWLFLKENTKRPPAVCSIWNRKQLAQGARGQSPGERPCGGMAQELTSSSPGMLVWPSIIAV